MNELLQFVVRHGYTLVFAWVFIEQAGLPVPSAPLLLAAGALSGAHGMNLSLAITFAVLASVASDSIWYELGRRKGVRVLRLLCRISLEPDSCVRQTEDVFARHGARSLLVAKFVPGLNTVAPPLAGIFRMRLSRFMVFNGVGTVLWAGAFVALGYSFRE